MSDRTIMRLSARFVLHGPHEFAKRDIEQLEGRVRMAVEHFYQVLPGEPDLISDLTVTGVAEPDQEDYWRERALKSEEAARTNAQSLGELREALRTELGIPEGMVVTLEEMRRILRETR